MKKNIFTCHYCDKKSHTVKKCRFWINDGRPPKPAKAKFTKTNNDGATLLTVSSEVFVADTGDNS